MNEQEKKELIIFICGCEKNWLPFDIPVNRENMLRLIEETRFKQCEEFKEEIKDMTANQFIERLK